MSITQNTKLGNILNVRRVICILYLMPEQFGKVHVLHCHQEAKTLNKQKWGKVQYSVKDWVDKQNENNSESPLMDK